MPRHPPYALIHLITIKFKAFISLLRFLLEFSVLFNFLLVNIYVVYNFRYRPSYVFCYSVFKDRLLFRLEDQSSKTEQEMFHNSLLLLYFLLRKEVIHPHVPVGIPCYDFTPIIDPTLDSSLLSVKPPASGVINSHGVTGGVYKARERIHRGMLIRDY